VAAIRVLPRSGAAPRIEITTTFLGLIGAASPLATVFSEDVLKAEWRDETSLRAFYDLLHHRLVSLFFRSWQRARFSASFEADGTDVFTRRMLAFVGVDLAGAVPKRGLAPLELLAIAPLAATRGRTARTAQIVIARLVCAPVRIEQFVARTVQIGDDQRCLLGQQNCTLDQDFTIGGSVTDRSGRFRVVVGPLDYPTFESFMPGGRRHAHLRNVVMQFSPAHLEAELELFVGPECTPRFQLGREPCCELGVTTHLSPDNDNPLRARFTLGENVEDVTARFVTESASGTGDPASL
jgi:type VI secretion system protein ImpH